MRFKLTMLALVAGASLAANATTLTTDAQVRQGTSADNATIVAQASNAGNARVEAVPSGNQPHPKPRAAGATGTESRSDVKSDATGAAKAGAIDTGNEPHPKPRAAGSTGTEARTDVRADAAGAAKAGAIATGNEPHQADRKNKNKNQNAKP